MFAWLGLVIYRRYCQTKQVEDQEQPAVDMETGEPIGVNGQMSGVGTTKDGQKDGGQVNGGMVNPALTVGENSTKF